MYFSREDILKIQKALIQLSIKDSEMPEAYTPFNIDDTISIVQKGYNKKISVKEFIDLLQYLKKEDDFVNIVDTYDESFITLEEAIQLIPEVKRKKGLVITFQDTGGNWLMYQFRGELNQWNIAGAWKDLYDFTEYIVNSVLPDEEDLTKVLVDSKGNYASKLKDRAYDPENFSGLGRVILRKNIVEVEDPIYGKVKKNILYQDMINNSNTIYEIRYDFDLKGQEITIPEGCILDFQGGCLNNGTIYLSSNCIFEGNGSTCIELHIYAIGTGQSNISNITIRNLTIDNNNAPSYNLLRFHYCNNILLDNLIFLNYMKSDEALDDSPNIVWFEKGSVAYNNYCSNFTILNTKILDCSYEAFTILNSSNIVVDNMTVDDTNSISAEWSSLNIMRCVYVKVINSYFSHRLSNNISGSTLNFCSSHSILDNCHIIGGNGIDIGDELAQDEQYVGTVFNVEDITIQNSHFNTSKGCIHTVSSKGYTKDVRVINCKIIARFTKDSYKARAFQLTNCINFLADNCDISADELLQYYATFTDNVQDINGLGNYHINNCKFEFYREAYEGIFHSSTGGTFTDIYLNNCIITDTFSPYISIVQGGDSYNSVNILNSTFNVNNIKISLNENIEKTIFKSNIFNYDSLPTSSTGIKHSFLVSNSLGEFVMEGNICNNMLIKIGSNGTYACDEIKDIKNNIFNNVQVYIPDVTDFKNLLLHENLGKNGLKITIYGQENILPDNTNKIYLNSNIKWNLYNMGAATERMLIQYMAVHNPITAQYDDVRSGTFANRPAYAVVGEHYFCTDKQTIEGAIKGIVIYHKGNNIWVDALGRVVE